jgi:hypothetical protein
VVSQLSKIIRGIQGDSRGIVVVSNYTNPWGMIPCYLCVDEKIGAWWSGDKVNAERFVTEEQARQVLIDFYDTRFRDFRMIPRRNVGKTRGWVET